MFIMNHTFKESIKVKQSEKNIHRNDKSLFLFCSVFYMWSAFDVLLWLITPSVSELIMFMESSKNIFSRYNSIKTLMKEEVCILMKLLYVN